MEPNQIIHEAMGLCWHKEDMSAAYCSKWACCGASMVLGSQLPFPDYSQPEHIGKVYAWMQQKPGKGYAPRWRDFNKWWFLRKHDSFKCLPFDKQIKIIAEWITEGVE